MPARSRLCLLVAIVLLAACRPATPAAQAIGESRPDDSTPTAIAETPALPPPTPTRSSTSTPTPAPSPTSPPTATGPPGPIALVVNVVDGDTIDVNLNGATYRVRYIGIDTPERGQPCYAESADLNAALVAGRQVTLVKDISETDRYGRLLRYLYVGDVFVNAELVTRGYAQAVEYPPDVAFADYLEGLEAGARAAGRGCLFGGAPANPTPAPAGNGYTCAGGTACIKGNINSQQERIYHFPGCAYYEQTRIDIGKGERWFVTSAEAEAAGWRRAKNCP